MCLMNRTVFSSMTAGVLVACCSCVPFGTVQAADKNDLPRPEPIPGRAMLPQDHQYQRQLRKFMAGLTEKDFDHGVKAGFTVAPVADPEDKYRLWLLSLALEPLVGTKRGAPSVNAPPSLFVLSSIEGERAVMQPPVWPEPLTWLVRWNYAGNPYYNSRALKLRAFVTMSVQLMMLDDQQEKFPEKAANRSDWFGPQLILLANPYPGVKDVLPREVQQAYETGLRKMGRRLLDWGPKGEESNLDMIGPIGIWYVARALNDREFTREAEAFARRMFTDERYFHPAGYYVDRGGPDVGFNGMANYFANWAALASEWPFAREAVERVYRLRAHLCLPEPDGQMLGPSHFNTRTSSDAWHDQWPWGYRDYAAAMLTDEAAYLTKLPSAEELNAAAEKRVSAFRAQLAENPRRPDGTFLRNEEIASSPWAFRIWQSWNFPMINFAYEHYRKGAYAHRAKLEQEKSPYLKSPFERGETFVREFGKAFVVAKLPAYATILHTGPVGGEEIEDSLFKFAGPYGLGGGQLSAFWTPATGSVILGRRGGMSFDKNFDKVDEWRLWPIHAVSGCKADGKVFTSARIRKPDVACELEKGSGTVRVGGTIPLELLGQGKVLEGRIECNRIFKIEPDKLRVETVVKAYGQDKIAELYETLPVFHRDANFQKGGTTIEFLAEGKWGPATAEYQDKVEAVKLTRFNGTVQVRFERPRRVKLSPQDWTDTYLSGAVCRNVLIDLLESGDKPVVFNGASSRYEIVLQ